MKEEFGHGVASLYQTQQHSARCCQCTINLFLLVAKIPLVYHYNRSKKIKERLARTPYHYELHIMPKERLSQSTRTITRELKHNKNKNNGREPSDITKNPETLKGMIESLPFIERSCLWKDKKNKNLPVKSIDNKNMITWAKVKGNFPSDRPIPSLPKLVFSGYSVKRRPELFVLFVRFPLAFVRVSLGLGNVTLCEGVGG